MLYEGIQHVRMFRVSWPSRPNGILDELNKGSVVSLGITTCDTPRKMLTNVILLCIFYIQNNYSNNINNEKFHLLLLLLR